MTTTDPPTTTVFNPITEPVSPPSPSKFFQNIIDMQKIAWWIWSASIVDDVRLSFRGNSIANNSIVLLSDIGDNMDSRIQYITTNPDCCTRTLGVWLFPSGRQMNSRGSGDVIYQSRSRAGPTKLASVSLGR